MHKFYFSQSNFFNENVITGLTTGDVLNARLLHSFSPHPTVFQ